MKLYTIYTEKNGPNNRLIKKEKKQTVCSKNVKRGTRRKPIGFVIKPWIILTKYKELSAIVLIRCYHQPIPLWVSFLKAKQLKMVTSFSKLSNLLFILFLQWKDDWTSFSVLPIRSFHIAGPLMEIPNPHLHYLICGFL